MASSSTDDQMIADYLGQLEAAADAVLPPDRRAELLDEIGTHIAEARAAQSADAPDDVTTVLSRLGSPADIVQAAAEQAGTGGGGFGPGLPAPGAAGAGYGPPGSAAPGGAGPGQGASGYGGSAGPPPWQGRPEYAAASPALRPGLGWMEVVAIVLLLIGAFLAGIGWVVGVILLWLSPRWRVSDKLLGTFVWPGGLAAILIVLGAAAVLPASSTTCHASAAVNGCLPSSGIQPVWLGVIAALAVVAVGLTGSIAVTVRLVRQARRWASQAAGDSAGMPSG